MVNFLNYDHLLFEVHSVKSGVSFHVVRLGLPQLGLNVEFLWCVPRFFLVFLFFFLTSVGQAGGREAAPATHTCTATLVCKAGTLGTQFASPLFFFFFSFFFFFCWLLLFVPASVFWFLNRFWTGFMSQCVQSAAPAQPLEALHQPRARSMRPPCWRIVCHLNLTLLSLHG